MPLPWLRILDVVIGVTDLARSRKIRQAAAEEPPPQSLEPRGPAGASAMEARLPGLVVAALKEAFDRDTRRLELERAQLEAERERSERALKLELLRQAGDRELGRLRLLAGTAVAVSVGLLFLASRLPTGLNGAKVALGIGWVLLLGSIATSLQAQADVGEIMNRGPAADHRDVIPSTIAGALALWLLILGLAVSGLAQLLA